MISFPAFFERAPVAIIVVVNGKVTNCNAATFKIFENFSKKDLIGKVFWTLFVPPAPEKARTEPEFDTKKADTAQSVDPPVSLQIKDLHRTVELECMESETDSREKYYFLNLVNPSLNDQQKEARWQRESEHRLKSFMDNSPDVIMEFDSELRHLYVNEKAEALTGIPADEFIGKTHEELKFPDHLVTLFDNALHEVFSTGKENRVEFQLPNGCYIDWYLVPGYVKDGKIETVLGIARDITQIKHTEEALLDSQIKLSEAMKVAKLAFWEFDIVNSSILLHKEFGTMVGESWETPRRISLEDYSKAYIYPPDRDKVKDALQLAQAKHFKDLEGTMEFRIQKSDGSLINVFNIIIVAFDEQGEPVHCDGIIQDISLLRKAEEELRDYHLNLEKLIAQRTTELRQSEERLSDAVKLAKLTTWEFNFQTKRFHGGGEMYEILGPIKTMENDSMEATVFEKLIHPDDLPVYYSSFEKALKSNNKDYLDYIEYRIIRADGDIRNLYLSIKVDIGPDGKHLRHYGTIQDITTIRRAEEEKERLTSIIEVTPDIVAIMNPEGYLIYLNQSGRFFYGLIEQEDLSQINFIDIQKNESKALLENIGLPVARKEGIWTGESELHGRNDQNVPASMSIVAHFDQDGSITSYSTIIRNISAQKKTEQDLIYKNAELDTFVYRASHDLRGPISSLLGLYQIVQYEIKEEKALEFFDMFNKQILRLNDIILALINLTKIKESTAAESPINFTSIVNEAIDSLRHLEEFSRIQFKISIDVKKEFASDKGLITTIIQNLIENAIKYSRKNIDFAYCDITIASTVKNTLVIRVEDNGIGIGKDIQFKIFDMFFRGHEISKGSGLGLYILKNAVDKLHGKIKLESEAGLGTTFNIEVPYIN